MKPAHTNHRNLAATTSSSNTVRPRPESPTSEPRKSIFDTSYALEGAERRKAWSRFDRKKQ